ncbi:DUF4190 domain-containing protein [Kitasatospora sp. NPDC097605]|uniref:DUF4190 domain-containing protein n=1 Tax=Kitasatospora sp. NPDC097605 TaxID=3157226 RepID=UPI003333A3E8
MSKPESDAAVPEPEPVERVELTKPAAVPAPEAEPVSEAEPAPEAEPVSETGPAPAPTPEAAPAAEPAPAPAPAAAPTPPPAPSPWAAPAPGAAPTAPPPGADPWAPPPGVLQPPPFDPDQPRLTGWAAVTPGAHSGFQPGYPYPAAPTTTNGFSVAALVTGLLCMWPLALVFAIVALVQIPKRNEKGRGMAVTGLVTGVLGAIVMLFAFIGLVAAGFDEERYGDTPLGAPKGSVSIDDLVTGDCFNEPPTSPGKDPESTSLYWVRVVPCSSPHHGEVAGFSDIAGRGPAEYPTRTEIEKSAARLCNPVRDDYALDPWLVPDGMEDSYYYPSHNGWASGDRRLTCTFQDSTRTHTGSVRTDRTKLTQAQRTYLDAAQAYNGALAVQPEGEADEEPAEYRTWAKTMAGACRKEVKDLSANGVDWPAGARAKLIEMGAIKLDEANAWDTVAKSGDEQTLGREMQKVEALSAKSSALAVEIRRELGLSTGEQASDIRV